MYDQMLVRLRPGSDADTYGDQVPDWTTATQARIGPVSVQPQTRDETTSAVRSVKHSSCAVLGAPGVDIDLRASDRVLWNGQTWEVDGEVSRWTNGSGGVHHVEAIIRRVAG